MHVFSEEKQRLVLRVNELFHDLEGAKYDDVHPEIFLKEKERWERKLRKFWPQSTPPLTMLDIGAGTGFVSMLLLPYMKATDSLIFADISQQMLDVCQKKIMAMGKTASCHPLKMSNELLEIPDSSVDIVTMNSVLHHIPNVQLLVDEIGRVLKPNGLVFIGHEPNAVFLKHSFLFAQYQLFSRLAPKRLAASLLKKLGLYGRVVKPMQKDEILEHMNDHLMHEQLIKTPLSRHEVSMLVDIHSFTAGGLHLDRGLLPKEVLPSSNFKLLSLETYNHLSKASKNTRCFSLYERLLQKIYPHQGAIFFLVAEKIG